MNVRIQHSNRAFTLIEVLLAIAILGVVLGAIFSSWSGILRAKQVAVRAAASAQRERMAMRVIQEALVASQLYVANVRYYGFANEAVIGGENSLSFVARLPKSFPRSGKFGDFDVRRVAFSVELDGERRKQLVMRQCSILMEMDEDEKTHPVVLADDVKDFQVEFWDVTKSDWTDVWLQTNQLPKLVRVSLQLNFTGMHSTRTADMVTRVMSLPTVGVPQNWQIPMVTGGNTTSRTNRTQDTRQQDGSSGAPPIKL